MGSPTPARPGYRRTMISDTMGGMTDTVAARLAPLTALDEKRARVALGTFWQERPAVLGFVRHFG